LAEGKEKDENCPLYITKFLSGPLKGIVFLLYMLLKQNNFPLDFESFMRNTFIFEKFEVQSV